MNSCREDRRSVLCIVINLVCLIKLQFEIICQILAVGSFTWVERLSRLGHYVLTVVWIKCNDCVIHQATDIEVLVETTGGVYFVK